jgi:cytochrome c553
MKTLKSLSLQILLGAAVVALATTAQARGNADLGKATVDKVACASCHGADFQSPAAPIYPKLAGQHYDYLVQALKGYKNPKNQMMGRTNALMNGFAAQLSNDDIENVAAYLSGLNGSLVVQR